MSADEIASKLTPLQADALIQCWRRGSTRSNDGGLVDTLLSGLCSKTDESIANSWLVTWAMNLDGRSGGYISIYRPTKLGEAVAAILANAIAEIGS